MVAVRRIVLIALALSVPVAIAVFVPVWRYGVVKGPGTYVGVAGQHSPTTPQERAAAGVGLSYVRAAQLGDLDAACDVAVRRAARRLRCAEKPSFPRALKPGGGRLETIDAIVNGSRAVMVIGDGSDMANFLRMRRWHGIWRVAEHRRGHTI
jgi:hypothetical protein